MPSGYTNRQWKGKYCGAYEIALYAEVTRAQVAHWLKEEWFPKTVDEPRMGRLWDYAEVVKALNEKGYPKVGPPGRRVRKPELSREEIHENAAELGVGALMPYDAPVALP